MSTPLFDPVIERFVNELDAHVEFPNEIPEPLLANDTDYFEEDEVEQELINALRDNTEALKALKLALNSVPLATTLAGGGDNGARAEFTEEVEVVSLTPKEGQTAKGVWRALNVEVRNSNGQKRYAMAFEHDVKLEGTKKLKAAFAEGDRVTVTFKEDKPSPTGSKRFKITSVQ